MLTLVLVALVMGMYFAYTLELPVKMTYGGSLYVRLQNTLYAAFGPPRPEALNVPGAVLAAVVLVFLVRGRRPAIYLTLVGAICLALALPVIFFGFPEPVNVVLESSTPRSVPPDWMKRRRQWEHSHAASFTLNLVGFGVLVISVLVEPRQSEASPEETNRETGDMRYRHIRVRLRSLPVVGRPAGGRILDCQCPDTRERPGALRYSAGFPPFGVGLPHLVDRGRRGNRSSRVLRSGPLCSPLDRPVPADSRGVLALSLIPDAVMFLGDEPGHNSEAIIPLMSMHVIDAAICVGLLTTLTRERGS